MLPNASSIQHNVSHLLQLTSSTQCFAVMVYVSTSCTFPTNSYSRQQNYGFCSSSSGNARPNLGVGFGLSSMQHPQLNEPATSNTIVNQFREIIPVIQLSESSMDNFILDTVPRLSGLHDFETNRITHYARDSKQTYAAFQERRFHECLDEKFLTLEHQ